ncbi:hypothetical protein LTS17_000460 [Exophiala oligosperma]
MGTLSTATVAIVALALGLWNTIQNNDLIRRASIDARNTLKSVVVGDLDGSGQPSTTSEYVCTHQYSIEMVSDDPLMIYINGFLSPYEIDYLMDMAQEKVYYNRTASRAFVVPNPDPVGQCITARAEKISGFLPWAIFEELQVVRYTPGERHDMHKDNMDRPFPHEGIGDRCNRLLSFFVYIGDQCEGGETYFPHQLAAPDDSDTAKFGRTTKNSSRGLVVRPVAGNGLFWINLKKDWTTDERLKHASLPVTKGVKYGMNILGEGCY